MSNEPDGIVISASHSDPERFAAIFDRHYAAVRAHLVCRVARSLADELAADTFLTAFERRSAFDTARPDARPWLLGIAVNKLRRYRRDERRELRAYARASNGIAHDAFEDADSRISASLLRTRLADALARLSDGDRDALLLHAWADLSYAETADALSIPVGTVRSRLARARDQLQAYLADAASDVSSEPRRPQWTS